MNKLEIKIDNVDYTKKLILPIKWGDLLDERLDELYISLRNLKLEAPFTPMSLVELTIENSPETKQLGVKETNNTLIEQTFENHKLTQKQTKRYIVAKDSVQECPVGSKLYIHDIYIIEETKILEGFVCDTLMFTNPLGNDYIGAGSFATDTFNYSKRGTSISPITDSGTRIGTYIKANISNSLVPIPTGSQLLDNDTNLPYNEVLEQAINLVSYTEKWVKRWLTYPNGTTEQIADTVTSLTNATLGTYTLKYEAHYWKNIGAGGDYEQATVTYQFSFAVVENKLPLKKWTITDVIKRCLQTAELIQDGDTPRFTLNEEQATEYDKIIAPEFAFTRCTLREQLKQIGNYIHAEPRLYNGKIYFDKYGNNEYASISAKKHISMQASQDINEYCTGLDSQADNLVNRLSYNEGVMIEPFSTGFRSLRSETTTVRLDEDNNTIATTLKDIYSISTSSGAVIVRIGNKDYDITPYVFEKADYDLMSSYDGEYPYSKAFAIYYEQGKKGIKGLFYKAPNPISTIFNNYAILNILRKVSGDDKLTVTYPELQFRISYIPIFNERIHTSKSILLSARYPRNLVYNQGANLIETRFYGENLKGVVARMGNIDKTLTYKVGFLTDIPKAGQLFDDEYYISTVYVEVRSTYFKITIGLSKDFNRLSQYVGISSNIRQYEISEKQAQERNILINSYVIISLDKTKTGEDSFLTNYGLSTIRGLFNNTWGNNRVETAYITTYSKKKAKIAEIELPVISTAFGNSLAFQFNMQDNYSAGQKVTHETQGEISGYWGKYVPYADYYGRLYYMSITLANTTASMSGDYEKTIPTKSTDALYKLLDDEDILIRKDSREVLAFSQQVEFLTDTNIIIGSGLTHNLSLVTGKFIGQALKIYFLTRRIGLFEQFIDLTGVESKELDIALPELTAPYYFDIKNVTAPINAKAWVIATPMKQEKITCEDEDGNIVEQVLSYGGEVVLARNIDINNGDTIKLPRFYTKKKLY